MVEHRSRDWIRAARDMSFRLWWPGLISRRYLRCFWPRFQRGKEQCRKFSCRPENWTSHEYDWTAYLELSDAKASCVQKKRSARRTGGSLRGCTATLSATICRLDAFAKNARLRVVRLPKRQAAFTEFRREQKKLCAFFRLARLGFQPKKGATCTASCIDSKSSGDLERVY